MVVHPTCLVQMKGDHEDLPAGTGNEGTVTSDTTPVPCKHVEAQGKDHISLRRDLRLN